MTTDRQHVWRQDGMTGSDHDECVLCGAVSDGMGITPEQSAASGAHLPCKWSIYERTYHGNPKVYLRLRYEPGP